MELDTMNFHVPNLFMYISYILCGLVVRSRGPGSIPGATRCSERSGTGFTQPREHNCGATWKKK
jgi:hypothetical protein